MPRRLVRRLTRLTRAEWADLLRAQAALIRAQLAVWMRPRGQLIAPPGATANAGESPDAVHVARRLGLAVDRAASYGVFRPRCLVRALALQRMLEARGINGSRLRIGVHRRGERLLAHAWVEYGTLVLGDRAEHVRRFHELTDLGVRH